VLALTSPPSRTFLRGVRSAEEVRFGETPKPARETRALPSLALGAFTVVELLIVMTIILILAGLILATSGYVQEKGKRSRTEAEIAALSAALESYKADNGIYPTEANETEMIDPSVFPADPKGSKYLYGQLSGDPDFDGIATEKTYMSFKPQNLSWADMSLEVGPGNLITAIRDPFGNPCGYSTAKAVGRTIGYNPTFDLWSTSGDKKDGETDDQYRMRWIKNW